MIILMTQLAGGSWYSKNNEFEIELVELLYAQTYRLLLEKTNSARTNPLFTVNLYFYRC